MVRPGGLGGAGTRCDWVTHARRRWQYLWLPAVLLSAGTDEWSINQGEGMLCGPAVAAGPPIILLHYACCRLLWLWQPVFEWVLAALHPAS